MIRENILRVKERIIDTCRQCARDPSLIKIVCVSKARSVEQIREAVACGLLDLGENKIQEAILKYSDQSLAVIDQLIWHMIGHLQSNKAKEAVKIFDLIHSVDSLKLVREIDKQAEKIGKLQELLLEVKTSPEETKSGFSIQEIPALTKELNNFSNIKVRGLMTIAPLQAEGIKARPYFAALRQLRDDLNPGWLLSMGMSDDFTAAIIEGADILRLGRVIFDG
ncbi:MAG: YggS family pyridoxal phosphate-dependent enzyme [Candidatus Omnitrophica bacterium]|jgi:hypothetical protein|nr:YggS family pyridoxal phosphate-dependent enzyme [Candidatus Omnitrophota bacterium]